jgi:hypothetical protein
VKEKSVLIGLGLQHSFSDRPAQTGLNKNVDVYAQFKVWHAVYLNTVAFYDSTVHVDVD